MLFDLLSMGLLALVAHRSEEHGRHVLHIGCVAHGGGLEALSRSLEAPSLHLLRLFMSV